MSDDLYKRAMSHLRYWAENADKETTYRENRDHYLTRASQWAVIALALKTPPPE